ncbi:MAG: hypothetical protein IJ677_09025, partial [Alphaproteobacteria bacterium]|nr:hypothetical protein [Alphaproteobacteria bacterium]
LAEKEKEKTNKVSESTDIDIENLLNIGNDGDREKNNKKSSVSDYEKTSAAIDSETLLKTAKQVASEQEKNISKSQTFGSAMQKIKNAITETANISLDKIKEKPISLNDIKDDLTDSFSKAFSSKKEEPSEQISEEEWEYVDENGNPINSDEWEYVDENGNPVNPAEWEYVDENGNPVNPAEWEYVDENGNPIEK